MTAWLLPGESAVAAGEQLALPALTVAVQSVVPPEAMVAVPPVGVPELPDWLLATVAVKTTVCSLPQVPPDEACTLVVVEAFVTLPDVVPDDGWNDVSPE